MANTYEAQRAPALHEHTDWKTAAWAGVAGGAVFLVMEMMLVWLAMGESPWAPPRMMAAMVMGQGVLPPPATFDAVIVAVAMLVHFALSVAYGLLLGWIVHRMGMGMALLTGAVFGLVAIYLVNFHLIAPAVFPWFTMAQNWISVLSHVVFGLVVAGVYVAYRDRHA